MGSFANSLHVKHADPKAVAAAIERVLDGPVRSQRKEWHEQNDRMHAQPSADDTKRRDGADRSDDDEDELDDDDFDDDEDDELDAPGPSALPERRRLKLFAPVAGWVGVLDEEMDHELAQRLSEQLGADCCAVYVNDSDAWGMTLYRKGIEIDSFDSMGEEDDAEDKLVGQLAAAEAAGGEKAVAKLMEEIVLKNAPKGPITFIDGAEAPPIHLTMLAGKIHDGSATFFDRLRYKAGMLRYVGGMLWRMWRGRKSPMGFEISRQTPLTAKQIDSVVGNVRSFFPAADEQRLRKLLPQSRFPAEDLLGDFLEIVGLPRLYQGLSYEYLSDFGKRELKSHGIDFACKVDFKF